MNVSNQENKELEQLASILRKENTKENLDRLVRCLEKSNLYVPAAFPPDTDPALIRQIASGAGKEQKIPEGLSPRPAVLQNNEGKRFLPVFTTQEQAVKGDQQFPLILTMPFSTCLDLVGGDRTIEGILLNAFDQCIPLNVNKNTNAESQPPQYTETQLHAISRQRVEAELLPEMLFNKGSEGLRLLRENCGFQMLQLYKEAYPDLLPCPYEEEDFDFLSINAREDLTVIRITMPAKHMYAGICPIILIRWNPLDDSIRYFAVVKGEKEGEAQLFEALPDGSKRDFGAAPADGSELQYMIDFEDERKA